VDCTGLTSLPDGLRVGEHLFLDGCINLESLPLNINVVGDMKLRGCTGLRSLPDNFHVGEVLDLSDCTELTSLPDGLRIGKHLILAGCISLTSLPNWITTLGPCSNGSIREVVLTGTGLSDEIIERLINTPAPGMQFHFGNIAAPVQRNFDSLNHALAFWGGIVQRRDLPELNLQENSLEDMIHFLERLINTAEYQNAQTRNPLAIRVLNMASFLSENEDMKAKALGLIHQGLESCDDRVIATLDDVELLGKIHEAEKESPSQEAEEKLRQLGMAIYKLEEVRKYARIHMENLQWVDEVEVQLAFQIGLTDPLSLPLSTKNMLFRRCASVSDREIEAVGQRIEQECTRERVYQFLASWDPWARHNRRKAIPSYEDLLIDPVPLQRPVNCEILYAEAPKPVRYNQNIFDYGALCKVYIEKGKNPFTNLEIQWEDVRRLQTV